MVPISLAFTNYKRFPAFLLDLSRDCLVISGENGSGKTQLLWGCLIFFHAFNRMCGRDEAEIDSIRLTGENLAMLLGCPSIASLNSFRSFANRQIGKMADTSIQFQATFDNEETWSVFLQINGKVDFQYNKALYPVQKIRFAYQSLGFHFCHPVDEIRGSLDVLTSAVQNIRALFSYLEHDRRNKIEVHLKQLLEIKSIRFSPSELTYNELFICEHTEGQELEIMHCGSALQKVLSGLFLLETLIQIQETFIGKYFLIEEIETLLYPSLIMNYYNIIKNLCNSYKIKLIMTSNSQQILESLENDSKIYLSLKFPGENE